MHACIADATILALCYCNMFQGVRTDTLQQQAQQHVYQV